LVVALFSESAALYFLNQLLYSCFLNQLVTEKI